MHVFACRYLYEWRMEIVIYTANFYVLLTVLLSIILGNDQLHAQLLDFTIGLLCTFTCFEHYTCMLMIRRLNCTDAASVSSLSVSSYPMQVHRIATY